jgi:hypothetical protein
MESGHKTTAITGADPVRRRFQRRGHSRAPRLTAQGLRREKVETIRLDRD